MNISICNAQPRPAELQIRQDGINERRLVPDKFSWQEDFGAFSYGKSQIPDVAQYIETQEKHHKKRTFMEEQLEFLNLFGIAYDESYVFKAVE